MKRAVLLSLGVLSSLLYIVTDIMGARRYRGYSYRDQEFSELTAQEAPTRRFMVATNVISVRPAGGRLRGGGPDGGWLDARRPGHRSHAGRVCGVRRGWRLLFPMRTRERLAAGEAGVRNAGHPVATGLMSLCVVMAMGFGSRLLGRRFRRYSYGTIAALVVPGVVVSTQVGRMVRNERTPWMGLAERVNIYATMLGSRRWPSVCCERGTVNATLSGSRSGCLTSGRPS